MLNSPSALALQSLGYKPARLPPSPVNGHCGLCGVQLVQGKTPARKFEPAMEFTAYEFLHPGRSEYICAACEVIASTTTGFMSRFSRAVFTPQGAHRLTSAEDVCWMALQLDPPFVAVFNTKSSAHVVWHAPVTYDCRSIGVVLGPQIITIDRHAVLLAREALARLTTVANLARGAHYQWPVFNLSLYDDVVDLCRLIPSHERVLRSSEDEQVLADLKVFDDLSPGDRWALSALLLTRAKRDTPVGTFDAPPLLHRVPDAVLKAQRAA